MTGHGKIKLSTRHQKVVDGYMVHYNKTKAMRDAGFSESTSMRAADVFDRIDVQMEIQRRQDNMSKKAEVTADYVIKKFKDIVEADLGDLLEIFEDGTARIDFTKATPAHLAALGEFTVDDIKQGRGDDAIPVQRIRVKFHDKLRALEALGRHLGLFNDKIEIKGELDLIRTIENRRKAIIEEGYEDDSDDV